MHRSVGLYKTFLKHSVWLQLLWIMPSFPWGVRFCEGLEKSKFAEKALEKTFVETIVIVWVRWMLHDKYFNKTLKRVTFLLWSIIKTCEEILKTHHIGIWRPPKKLLSHIWTQTLSIQRKIICVYSRVVCTKGDTWLSYSALIGDPYLWYTCVYYI